MTATPPASETPTEAEVVTADQLNEVDREALRDQPLQTVAMASAEPDAAPDPSIIASNDNSAWDQTSMIGKIFICFGALLTLASAARMFMA